MLVVVSVGFTALSLSLTRGWIEEDLRERAIAFAREIAATIGDQRELESTALLHEQIRQILGIRRNVGQFVSRAELLTPLSAPLRLTPLAGATILSK